MIIKLPLYLFWAAASSLRRFGSHIRTKEKNRSHNYVTFCVLFGDEKAVRAVNGFFWVECKIPIENRKEIFR